MEGEQEGEVRVNGRGVGRRGEGEWKKEMKSER